MVPTHIVLLRQPFEVTLAQVGRVISLLGMLSVLVYRFARTSHEQQRLSAALSAAHDIQQRLVPVDIPTLGGLQTEIAYRAAEEVGGDFCQILPRPDGSIFVAIGDVSGKGLQAAMLGAVAVGRFAPSLTKRSHRTKRWSASIMSCCVPRAPALSPVSVWFSLQKAKLCWPMPAI
jgi:hypothetical protein